MAGHQYIPVRTCATPWRSGVPLSPQRWWELARGLAQALAVLEIHGIAHRDIKPANVIMGERGPVLIDFGIAPPGGRGIADRHRDRHGQPAWLSPEQSQPGLADRRE